MHLRSANGIIFILIYGLNHVNCEDDVGKVLICFFFSISNISDRTVWMIQINKKKHFLSGYPYVSSGEEQQIILDGGNERSIDVDTRSNHGGVCPGGRVCVPMSECTAIFYEVAKSCYSGDRSMYCGSNQYEPYICCPKSPLERNSVCGKTLVSGQFYRGLGAFPFVARIGFKSKLLLVFLKKILSSKLIF